MEFSERPRIGGDRNVNPGPFKKTDDSALLKKQASILIVDDEMIVRKMVARVMQAAGYNDVTEFDRREKALDFIEQLTRQGKSNILCVSDFSMPGNMNYNSFREEVLKRNPNVRMILITGTMAEAENSRAVADVRLAKPFAIDDLKASIEHVLDREGQ